MQAGKGGELTHDETTIISGALDLTEKVVSVKLSFVTYSNLSVSEFYSSRHKLLTYILFIAHNPFFFAGEGDP